MDEGESMKMRATSNGVGMALNKATLPLILYRKMETIEHV